MKIRVLYWPECLSHEEILSRIREVLAEEKIEADVEEVEVCKEEEGSRLGFAGSPTVLVEGADVQPESRDPSGRLTCRAYRKEDGSIGPIPSKETIRKALRAAAGKLPHISPE